MHDFNVMVLCGIACGLVATCGSYSLTAWNSAAFWTVGHCWAKDGPRTRRGGAMASKANLWPKGPS